MASFVYMTDEEHQRHMWRGGAVSYVYVWKNTDDDTEIKVVDALNTVLGQGSWPEVQQGLEFVLKASENHGNAVAVIGDNNLWPDNMPALVPYSAWAGRVRD